MSTENALIDGGKVAELRRLAGLSQRALARLLAVAPMTMRRIEEGGGHGDLTMRFVDRLAKQLGTDVASLLPEPTEIEPAGDDVAVEAALADVGRYVSLDELGRALGWSSQRAERALQALEARLATTGTMVKRKRVEYTLGPRRTAITEAQYEALQRVSINRWGLHLGTARVLRDVIDGRVGGDWERNAPAWKPLALGALLKHRLVSMDGQQALASPAVRFSLDISGQSVGNNSEGSESS